MIPLKRGLWLLGLRTTGRKTPVARKTFHKSSSKTFLEPQRGQWTPFGQRRATKYRLQASSSGNSFSNCGTVICWLRRSPPQTSPAALPNQSSERLSPQSGRVLLRHAAALCRRSVAYYCSAAYTLAEDPASAWHAAIDAPLEEKWRKLVNELIRNAEDIDADAIIGLKYELDSISPVSEVGVGLRHVLASGTAVKLSCVAELKDQHAYALLLSRAVRRCGQQWLWSESVRIPALMSCSLSA
jgi:Putative heavy-metal-binding